MSKVPVGARVGAILMATETEVYFLGWGVYDGEHEPPFGPNGMPLAQLKRDYPDFRWRNPRITLEDGQVVWGAHCWWGPEEATQRFIGDRTIVPAEVPDVG